MEEGAEYISQYILVMKGLVGSGDASVDSKADWSIRNLVYTRVFVAWQIY